MFDFYSKTDALAFVEVSRELVKTNYSKKRQEFSRKSCEHDQSVMSSS